MSTVPEPGGSSSVISVSDTTLNSNVSGGLTGAAVAGRFGICASTVFPIVTEVASVNPCR